MRMGKSNKKNKSPSRKRPAGSPGSKATQSSPATGVYRFSDEFINRGTTILSLSMVVMVGGGFLLVFMADSSFDVATQDIIGTTGACLLVAGITLPLLIAGILGGEAIRKGGGVLGFLLTMGMLASALGSNDLGKELLGAEGASWAFWGGISAMIIGGVGFWVVGWIAKVPMWIQGPEFGSPRAYVRRPAPRSRRHVSSVAAAPAEAEARPLARPPQ